MNHNLVEGMKDGAWISAISLPVWVIDPQWIPPVLLWGGLIVLAIRVALAIRDWYRK